MVSELGERFLVRQSGPLSGEVRVSGAKNSVLKLMVATLLAKGTSRLCNVPRIKDVSCMADLLASLGVKVAGPAVGLPSPAVSPPGSASSAVGPPGSASSAVGPPGSAELVLEVPAELSPEPPYGLVERMRASIVLLGPLVARCGWARIPLPGGDDFGNRPVNYHVGALQAMGAEVEVSHGEILARADRLRGTRVVLEYPSHTATDNVLMASVLAKGYTVIENAAREPEVVDLAAFLNAMGARIEGAGTSRVEVEGVEALEPASHEVVSDRVEAATFLAAVGIAGGDIVVQEGRPEHMDMLLEKLRSMGMDILEVPGGIRALRDPGKRLASVDVATLPYPGVATDYKPLLVAMLSIADGVAVVTENIFGGRFKYVAELSRMGADITVEGHHAVIRGRDFLQGATVRAPDIRAGAALVLAGLAAQGETTVLDARHVDRGYEDFAGKLAGIGANVERLS
jgi:UDP-N-acetylglucosamine 1-carboxyvinyltransferase